MLVSKCSDAVSKPAPKELSYEEMCKEEGVYTINGGSSSRRLVVLGAINPVVLYYDGIGLNPAVRSWRNYTFIKVDAEVCFEIKEKQA